MALTVGRGSTAYHYAFFVPTYLMPILHLWILWDTYRRIIGHAETAIGYSKTYWRASLRLIMIASVLTMPVILGVAFLRGGDLFLQMCLCLLLCREAIRVREKIDLGLNLKGLLAGLSLLIGCQVMNFMAYQFGGGAAQIFGFFMQFIYFLALIVFAYTLWDYAPLSRLDPADQQQLHRTNRHAYETLKSVLLLRR